MKFSLFCFSLLLAVACGNSDTHTHDDTEDHHDHASTDAVALPSAVTAPWSEAMASYLEVKDALVASDPALAQQAAAKLAASLGNADMASMGAAHNDWMQMVEPVKTAANALVAAGDVETTRQAFAALSIAIVPAVKTFGNGGQALYLQHCPMAFDNAGADWVSASEEISNPYYGEAMLTCGKTVETF